MIPPVAGHFQGKIHVVILVWVRKDCYFLGLSAVPALPLFGSTYIVLKKKKNFMALIGTGQRNCLQLESDLILDDSAVPPTVEKLRS